MHRPVGACPAGERRDLRFPLQFPLAVAFAFLFVIPQGSAFAVATGLTVHKKFVILSEGGAFAAAAEGPRSLSHTHTAKPFPPLAPYRSKSPPPLPVRTTFPAILTGDAHRTREPCPLQLSSRTKSPSVEPASKSPCCQIHQPPAEPPPTRQPLQTLPRSAAQSEAARHDPRL